MNCSSVTRRVRRVAPVCIAAPVAAAISGAAQD